MQSKTAAIQDEFEKLMSQMVKNRQGLGNAGSSTTNQYVGNTVDLLDNYYVPGPERKHKSPTRRLINHKNSVTQHKQRIQDNLRYSGQIGAYSQTYCIAPGQTYVIEAPEELPYEIADKQP